MYLTEWIPFLGLGLGLVAMGILCIAIIEM